MIFSRGPRLRSSYFTNSEMLCAVLSYNAFIITLVLRYSGTPVLLYTTMYSRPVKARARRISQQAPLRAARFSSFAKQDLGRLLTDKDHDKIRSCWGSSKGKKAWGRGETGHQRRQLSGLADCVVLLMMKDSYRKAAAAVTTRRNEGIRSI